MTEERLKIAEHLGATWDKRWQENPIGASADAMTASSVVLELVAAVRSLKAESARLIIAHDHLVMLLREREAKEVAAKSESSCQGNCGECKKHDS